MTRFVGWTGRYSCWVLCKTFQGRAGRDMKRIRPHFPERAGKVDAVGLISTPHARHVSDGAHGGSQPAFRGPEICGVGTEEDAAERDLTPRTISNCLRHLEIKPSKRSLTSNSFIKPLIVAGSPISINS